MRKLSLLLAICLMLICFVACNDEKGTEVSTSGDDTGSQTTTEQVDEVTEAPTKDATTKEPETPQDNWTGRY